MAAKFQAATVNKSTADAAADNIKAEMQHIADVNQKILDAVNKMGYKGKWNYAKGNPAELVAEVWTALMHNRNVPPGLAAVYLAYGRMRNAAIDKKLRRLFPDKQIPVFDQPEDVIEYIH